MIFVFSVDLEFSTFDKKVSIFIEKSLFKKEKINILMMKKTIRCDLDTLDDIIIVERGISGRSSSNVHFAI